MPNAFSQNDMTEEAVLKLSPEAFDALPFGLIRLDNLGTVLAYNTAEASLARRDKNTVIGRNFFTEVAPCTDTEMFAGRFRGLCAAGVPDSVSFDYDFRFPWGSRKVRIRLMFDSRANGWVFVTLL